MNPNETCGSGCGAHPIDRLEQEHTVILSVLDAAEAERARLRSGAPLRETFWVSYLDFLSNYADRCHQGKEEHVLFKVLEVRGMPADACSTAYMRMEHAEMRNIRARLVEALTSDDIDTICHLIGMSIGAFRSHIEKETEVLFPMARQALDDTAIAALAVGFDEVERRMGEGTHCRFEAVARSLCNDRSEAAHS